VPPLLTEDPARKKPPLEPDNPFADLVPHAVEPDNPFADLVKAANPSTYGLEPAPPSAMPVKRKPGFYKSPIPPAVVAPSDVTDITPKAEHTLGHHMPGQGESLPGALAESAMEMVTKPHMLAKELIMTAPRAGAAWSDYLKGTGTAKEAALKTLQTIALGAAGPAEKAVAGRLVSSLGPKLAEAAATTAVGAGAGASFTPDRPAVGAILGAAGGVARLPAAVADLGDVSAGAVEAGTQALKTAPPPPVHIPVDQPQPLSRPQEVLRARLATEGVVPAGPLKRRPAPVVPPPVEPPPDATAYTTKGAVRRPAAPQPEPRPIERRTENPPDRVTWTPEERARYITDSQKAYAAKINKPWSQWTPEEKAGYFANQTDVRAAAPWKPKNPPPKGNVDAETTDPAYIPTTEAVRYAIKELGAEQFKQAAMAQPHLQPKPGTGEPPTPGMAASGIESAAREIVRKAQEAESVSWPPPPKEGDITPVVSSNSEFEARPGVMRAVNKGEQPAALNSPLRLPEPSAEDRAIVQPKGYKEISPEEVAARKPAPVAEARPKEPQPATVDESGLFFEHRTPGGELRPFNRVSTEGLIRAHREMQEQIVRDQQLGVYRNVENENMSGTQASIMVQAATKTARGTSRQAEAAQRLRNYEKVMTRLDEELAKRGMSSDDVYDAIQRQEEHEAAIEQEAIHHADLTDEADTAFGDFEDLVPEKTGKSGPATESIAEKEPPISDVLNVAKLNLGDRTAEQRMAAKLEEFRAQREANKQTFAEADVNRAEILNELRAGDPIALSTEKAKKLSGEELLARRDLVRENDQIIQGLSKQLEGAATAEEHQQAAELLQKAVSHNDALLSDLVTGSSQKGRDLNLLRRMAQQSLDPEVWRVQAKRMLGDRPLTAEVDAMIRKLLKEATDACG
jgi:hypothetical protein